MSKTDKELTVDLLTSMLKYNASFSERNKGIVPNPLTTKDVKNMYLNLLEVIKEEKNSFSE